MEKENAIAYTGEGAGLLPLDDGSWQTLTEFFDLLLQVDRRINPHLYQKK